MMNGDPCNDFFNRAKECGLYFDQTDREYFSSEYSVDQLLTALDKYSERSKTGVIQYPSKYFGKLLESCSESNDTNNNSTQPQLSRKPHYPFTDENGVVWRSYEYAEKGGKWYKKDIIENQYGCDVIMWPCMKPPIETREEAERRVAEDKELGIYQESAQKFFDLAKHIVSKLEINAVPLLPAPALHPELIPEKVPWEKT